MSISHPSLRRVFAMLTGELLAIWHDRVEVGMMLTVALFAAGMVALVVGVDGMATTSLNEVRRVLTHDPSIRPLLVHDADLAPGLSEYLERHHWKAVALDADPKLALGSGEAVMMVVRDPSEPDGVRIEVAYRAAGPLASAPSPSWFTSLAEGWASTRRDERVRLATGDLDLLRLSHVKAVDVDAPLVVADSTPKQSGAEITADVAASERRACAGSVASLVIMMTLIPALSNLGRTLHQRSKGGLEPLMASPVRNWEIVVGKVGALLVIAALHNLLFQAVLAAALHFGDAERTVVVPILPSLLMTMTGATLGMLGTLVARHALSAMFAMQATAAVLYFPQGMIVAFGDQGLAALSWTPYGGQVAAVWAAAAGLPPNPAAQATSTVGTLMLCVALVCACHHAFRREAFLFQD